MEAADDECCTVELTIFKNTYQVPCSYSVVFDLDSRAYHPKAYLYSHEGDQIKKINILLNHN